MHLKYRIESEPRGTAGGVRACSDFYGREDFLVISGDAACSFDLLGLYRRHQQADAAVTIALYQNAEPLQYGLVLQDRQGLVQHFIEKPDWEHVVRNYEFDFRFAGKIKSHYALIGMAFVAGGYPLYYDAVNEKNTLA